MRSISFTEVSTMLRCQRQHAFKYTGHLTDGDVLSTKVDHVNLRMGRAWGKAMAAYHLKHEDGGSGSTAYAQQAITSSWAADAEQQREQGVYHQLDHEALEKRLHELVDVYAFENEGPLALENVERKLDLPVCTVDGERHSFTGYIDGSTKEGRRLWLVEFKLRMGKSLSSKKQAVRNRQIRYYAWAYREQYGEPFGVLLDETVNDLPEPVRLNKDGAISKVQSCRPQAYIQAGGENKAVLAKLKSKDRTKRHRIIFRPGELDANYKELCSAADQIHRLDREHVYPIASPSPLCRYCDFDDICDDPGDDAYIDTMFARKPPKRDRVDATQ